MARSLGWAPGGVAARPVHCRRAWNHRHPRLSWEELQAAIAPPLAGSIAYGVAAEQVGDRIAIDAYFASPRPELPPLQLRTDGGRDVLVEIRAHVSAPLSVNASPRPAHYSGVHPGAALDVEISGQRFQHGAMSALLAADPHAGEPTHLLTCGHVFRPGATRTSVLAARNAVTDGEEIGRLSLNLLDAASPLGPPFVDVALVTLTPFGRMLARTTDREPVLQDVIFENAVFAREVHAYRPTQRGFSEITTTSTGPFHGHVDDVDGWPAGFDIDGVVATLTCISEPGDSGTILATTEPSARGIGSCTASNSHASLFEPVARALRLLRPLFHLQLWRKA